MHYYVTHTHKWLSVSSQILIASWRHVALCVEPHLPPRSLAGLKSILKWFTQRMSELDVRLFHTSISVSCSSPTGNNTYVLHVEIPLFHPLPCFPKYQGLPFLVVPQGNLSLSPRSPCFPRLPQSSTSLTAVALLPCFAGRDEKLDATCMSR